MKPDLPNSWWWIGAWLAVIAGGSGAVIHLAPDEDIALWSGWNLLGLSWKSWRNLNGLACLALIPFLASMAISGIRHHLPRHWATPPLLLTLLLAGAIFEPTPLDHLLAIDQLGLSNRLFHPDTLPPIRRTGQLTLEEFARLRGIDPARAMIRLVDDGVPAHLITGSLEEMAARIGTTPGDIYSVIKPLEGSQTSPCIP
ncbi:MAG: hypothetical protein HQL56_05840 [Magnetococcales bacterium]|nr:hypothetical protein [Magnetococcales bacterium]